MVGAIIASTVLSAGSAIMSGQAQSRAHKAQARQAENDAKTKTIERKRALLETLALQNVGAASQGRTISSISHLQQEDIRKAGLDETIIKGNASASAAASRSAASSAMTSSLLSAAGTAVGGAAQVSKLGGAAKTASKWNKYSGTIRK